MKTIFEEMGGTYRREGDYFVPNLLPPEPPRHQIGKYGRLCQSYLKEHRPIVYNTMLLDGTLWQYLSDTDQTCNERMDFLTRLMAEREGVTDALKASDQMAWVGAMNNIRSRAEEIILREVVYE